mgnify:FL=1
MESAIKTLIVAKVHETRDYKHYVAYVVDENGEQHLVTPLNHSGNKKYSLPHDTYRHSHWDSPTVKAIRACRKSAQEMGHGEHYLVVTVSGNHETAQFSGDTDYTKERA